MQRIGKCLKTLGSLRVVNLELIASGRQQLNGAECRIEDNCKVSGIGQLLQQAPIYRRFAGTYLSG